MSFLSQTLKPLFFYNHVLVVIIIIIMFTYHLELFSRKCIIPVHRDGKLKDIWHIEKGSATNGSEFAKVRLNCCEKTLYIEWHSEHLGW